MPEIPIRPQPVDKPKVSQDEVPEESAPAWLDETVGVALPVEAISSPEVPTGARTRINLARERRVIE